MPGPVGAYVAGRHTTINNAIDPATAAELRKSYASMLTELEKAHQNLKMEGLESYAQAQSAVLANMAKGLQAYAQMGMAQSQSFQSQAEVMNGLFGKLYEAMGRRALAEPNAEASKDIQEAIRAAHSTATTRLRKVDIDKVLEQAASRSDEADAQRDLYAGLAKEVKEAYGGFVSNTRSHLLDAEDGMDRVATANFALEEGKAKLRDLLKDVAGNKLSPEQRAQFVEQYADRELVPAFTEGIGKEEWKRAKEQQVYSTNRMAETWKEIHSFMVGFPPEIKKQFEDLQTQSQLLVGGGPAEWMELVGRMPAPASMKTLRDNIHKWMAEVDEGGRPDPLNAAVRRMVNEVPGFTAWMQAMRFRNPEQAAIYASRRPFEFQQYQKWLAKDPSLADDPYALREMIKQKGREEGWGYFARRLERGLGFRIGGRRDRKNPPNPLTREDRLQLDLAGFPEPPVDMADLNSDQRAAVEAARATFGEGTPPLLTAEEEARLDPGSPVEQAAAREAAGQRAAGQGAPAPVEVQAPVQTAEERAQAAMRKQNAQSWGLVAGGDGSAPVLAGAPVAEAGQEAPVAAVAPSYGQAVADAARPFVDANTALTRGVADAARRIPGVGGFIDAAAEQIPNNMWRREVQVRQAAQDAGVVARQTGQAIGDAVQQTADAAGARYRAAEQEMNEAGAGYAASLFGAPPAPVAPAVAGPAAPDLDLLRRQTAEATNYQDYLAGVAAQARAVEGAGADTVTVPRR